MNLIRNIKKLFNWTTSLIPSGNNCWNCGRKIFNIESRFGEMGLCVYCYEAYEQGIESIIDKYPGQIEIECQNCKNIMTCCDKQINVLFRAKKIALCCDNPDYSYYIEE